MTKLSTLKRKRGLKFRALRKGDPLYTRHTAGYLAIVDGTGTVVAYANTDALFDKEGNWFDEY